MSDQTTQDEGLKRWQCFLFGALGGFIPVLLSLVTIDAGAIVKYYNELNVGHYIGHGIKISAMLFLGGLLAIMNSGVKQPLTLVQLGVAAPAIFTSYINAAPPVDPKQADSFLSIISTAHAAGDSTRPIVVAGFLNDVYRGATQRLDRAPKRRNYTPAANRTYAIVNRRTGVCTTSSSSNDPQIQMRILRRSFPPSRFTISQGNCP